MDIESLKSKNKFLKEKIFYALSIEEPVNEKIVDEVFNFVIEQQITLLDLLIENNDKYIEKNIIDGSSEDAFQKLRSNALLEAYKGRKLTYRELKVLFNVRKELK